MIRRPKATDTEEELLALQEKFLSSGEKPSASVKADSKKKVQVGSKRNQQGTSGRSEGHVESATHPRDVVDLQMEVTKPPAKRSKFKERRLKAKQPKSDQDQHGLMDSQDTHITKILSEIQEHKTPRFPVTSARYITGGFPSVQVLERTTTAMETASVSTKPEKKSLFAQQFETHDLSYFGVETGGPCNEGEPSEMECASEVKEKSRLKGGTVAGERLHPSTLISGEGLTFQGVTLEAAKDEVKKIHEENVERLLSLSEEEIKKERERIQQQLDPGLISFIKSRHAKHQKDLPKSSPDDHMTADSTQQLSASSGTASSMMPPESCLPELTPPTNWIHMDVVEKEKMEWMTDVDIRNSKGENSISNQGNEMRFSLEGLAIPREVILPSHLGLHHHGNDPQAAGYTLSELLSLCRSIVLQQRAFSLQVLTRIIQRARLDEYSGVTGDPVLQQLLVSGVPLLLRFALDESVGSVMFAAAACLHSLLVIPLENSVLDEYALCHLGCVLPSLKSHDKSHDQLTREEKETETDAETLQHDVIQGFLKMKLLHRLRYILEVCAPPTPLPAHLLDVSTRIARHSIYAATEVYNCPRLMDVVFRQFLPLDWSAENQEEGVVDGTACVSAMKLMHVLCSASRNIAASLVSHHKLLTVLVRYAVPPPLDLGLPQDLSQALSTTALLTWSVLLHYGLGSEIFRDTYSEVLKQLHSLSSSVKSKRDRALLCLVESSLHVAALTPKDLKIEGTGDTHPPPAIEWSHAYGLHTPLHSCLVSQSQVFSSDSSEGVSCAGNVLHCLASYYSLSPPNVSPIERVEEVDSLFDGPLVTLLHSSLFSQALQTLQESSSLATPPHESTPPPPSLLSHLTLTSPPPKPALYGRSTMQSSDYSDLIQPRLSLLAATHLVWGYIRLGWTAMQINKAIVSKVTDIVHNTLYWGYLEKVARAVGSKVSTFDLMEIYLLCDSVKLLQSVMELTTSVPEGCGQLTFDLAHKLLKLLPLGMEGIAWDLLFNTALCPSLISNKNHSLFLEQDVTSLSLKDPPHPITLKETSKASISMTTSQLLTASSDCLPSVRSAYQLTLREDGLVTQSKITRSESIFDGHPLQTPSMLLPSCHTHILPEDWVLLPVVHEYNRVTTGQRFTDTADHSQRVVTVVTSALQLLFLFEYLHPHLLEKMPTSAKLSRLMCVYLIDNELFLEKTVHDYLASLLRLYCREDKQLDFTVPVPGLSSFVDLYSSLLEQFSAVSYGDPLFSCYLLLPLQQKFTVHWRKLVWGEHPGIIRVLSLPLDEVPVPLENYLQPVETDTQLVDMYISSLAAQTVRSAWSPFFYLVAIHHTHNYLFGANHPSEPLRRKLLLKVINWSNQDTKRHLLLYAGVDLSSPHGFKLSDDLQDKQRTVISSLLGTISGVL